MKNFKRFAALLLAGLMMLAVFTGCSADTVVTNELGEQYVQTYIDGVNLVRSDDLPTLDNDSRATNLCLQVLDLIDEETGLLPKYEAYTYQDLGDGYYALTIVTVYCESYDDTYTKAIAVTPEFLAEYKASFETIANDPTTVQTYNNYEYIGAAYRVIGNNVYVAFAHRSTAKGMGN